MVVGGTPLSLLRSLALSLMWMASFTPNMQVIIWYYKFACNNYLARLLSGEVYTHVIMSACAFM